MADPWNTTYSPAGGLSSLFNWNVGDDSLAGLSGSGKKAMGAFGAGLSGVGREIQQRQAPKFSPPPDPNAAQPPQMGAFAPHPRAPVGNGFLDFLRQRRG